MNTNKNYLLSFNLEKEYPYKIVFKLKINQSLYINFFNQVFIKNSFSKILSNKKYHK
jgi:hypothetical protein